MDLFKLELELTDFSKTSTWRWRTRRIFIGWMLAIYYLYAFLFFFMVAFPEKDFFGLNEQPSTEIQAQHSQSQSNPGSVDPGGANKTTSEAANTPAHPLLLMVTFGFIGGVFFITRTFVRTSQKLAGDASERKDVSVAWYITRPLQSALMAIFIYYAFRAGQLVFYSMEGAPSEDQINVFTLSLIAIVAGAFSEQAFEKLHDIATKMFSVQSGDVKQ